MDQLVDMISEASGYRSSNDDDVADRLSSKYTVALLVSFAVLVSAGQYVQNPMTCWAPVHFTGAHTSFATNYCWIKNTYYVPWRSDMPEGQAEGEQTVPYYQWIPFILLFQAILFYLPNRFWHGLSSKSGIDVDSILQVAQATSSAEDVDSKKRAMMMLTNQMDRFLTHRVKPKGSRLNPRNLLSFVCGRRLGNYLVTLFLYSKVLYLANIIAQLFILNKILNIRFVSFGPDLIRNMAHSDDWTESNSVAFPRVTYCDFPVRGQDLRNTHTYTVQCVLPINIYNEKIYFFLWFWMIFVMLASIVSLFVWMFRFVFYSDKVKFVRNHLFLGRRIGSSRGTDEVRLINQFTSGYLRQDGVFLLRLIAHNTNSISTTEIVCAIWDFWMVNYNTGDSTETTSLQISSVYSLEDETIAEKM